MKHNTLTEINNLQRTYTSALLSHNKNINKIISDFAREHKIFETDALKIAYKSMTLTEISDIIKPDTTDVLFDITTLQTKYHTNLLQNTNSSDASIKSKISNQLSLFCKKYNITKSQAYRIAQNTLTVQEITQSICTKYV